MQHQIGVKLGISKGLSINQFFLVKVKNFLIVILTRNTCKMIKIGNEKVALTEIIFKFSTISDTNLSYQHMSP
jgi:hypothetical protein